MTSSKWCVVALFLAAAMAPVASAATINGIDVGAVDQFVASGGDVVGTDPSGFINAKLGTSVADADIVSLAVPARVCNGSDPDSLCRIDLGEATAFDFVLLEYQRRLEYPNSGVFANAKNFFLYRNVESLRYLVHDLVRNTGGPAQLCADGPRGIRSTSCVSGTLLSVRAGVIADDEVAVPAPAAHALLLLALGGLGLRTGRRVASRAMTGKACNLPGTGD